MIEKVYNEIFSEKLGKFVTFVAYIDETECIVDETEINEEKN